MLNRRAADAVARSITGWDRAAGPLYASLADALATALAASRIAAHLPSERALALALHVSRGTVADAYDVLRQRGLIDRQRGSGSVATQRAHAVCPDPIACVRAFFAG